MTAASPAAGGRTVLVTAASGGIGYAIAHHLATAGLRVVITGRDRDRGAAAEKSLGDQTGSTVRFLQADHATAAGNHALAEQVRDTLPALDLLVNNVGGLFPTRQVTSDGVELTLALNLRPAAQLTTELQPVLARSPDPHVINIASDAYTRYHGDPFTDVQSEQSYQPFLVYARAKLLLVLATLALADNFTGITFTAVNPGMAWTSNTQAITPQAVPAWRLIWPLVRWAQRRRSPQQAAAVVARLALQPPTIAGGAYITSTGKPRQLSAREMNADAQQRALRLALNATGAGQA